MEVITNEGKEFVRVLRNVEALCSPQLPLPLSSCAAVHPSLLFSAPLFTPLIFASSRPFSQLLFPPCTFSHSSSHMPPQEESCVKGCCESPVVS